jgi:hypothetical protein
MGWMASLKVLFITAAQISSSSMSVDGGIGSRAGLDTLEKQTFFSKTNNGPAFITSCYCAAITYNIHKFCILLTDCIPVFCKAVRTKTNICPYKIKWLLLITETLYMILDPCINWYGDYDDDDHNNNNSNKIHTSILEVVM